MSTTTYEVELLTPCFCAGADQTKAEIRVSSIRGQLRWWFRALGGTPEQEKEVFGGVHALRGERKEDAARASAVVLRVPPYDCRTSQELVMPHKKFQRAAVKAQTRFRVIMQARRANDEPLMQKAELAMKAWLLWGALGFRSNRGAGAVWHAGWAPTLEKFTERSLGVLASARDLGIWRPDAPIARAIADILEENFTTAEEARRVCADTIHHDALGYARGSNRLASPLRAKVVRFDDKFHVLRIDFPEPNGSVGRGIEALRRAGKKLGGPGSASIFKVEEANAGVSRHIG